MKLPKTSKADILQAFREQRFNDGLNQLRREQEKKEKRAKAKKKKARKKEVRSKKLQKGLDAIEAAVLPKKKKQKK